MRKNCSSHREKVLKLEAEGREFANILRSLEQFVRTVHTELITTQWYIKSKKSQTRPFPSIHN